jgi:hypothetical protein
MNHILRSDDTAHAASPAYRNGQTQTDGRLNGIAVVGLGYWGPNWVRNFHQLRCSRHVVACHLDAARR